MISLRAKRLLPLIAVLCVSFYEQPLAQQNTDSRLFNINVVDVDGAPYPGLKAENLLAWVDDKPRKITSLSFESGPVSVGILIDASASFGPARKDQSEFREKIFAGITRFFEATHPENEYFAVMFDRRVAFSEKWIGPDAPRLRKLNAPGDERGTVLYDALYQGIERLVNARHSRRVILIMSDGHDGTSNRTYKEVEELIKRSDVTIFALALYEDIPELSTYSAAGLRVLDDLTKLSGGRTMFVTYGAKAAEVNSAFDLVATALQKQYQISVAKENEPKLEKWSKLKLKLNLPNQKDRPQLFIWNRPGYYQ